MRKYLLILIAFSMLRAQNGANLIIFTPDEFYNALKPFAEWKKQCGYYTKVVKLSELGTTTNIPQAIRNYLLNAYNTWDIRPKYVIFVGTPQHIPFAYQQVNPYTWVYTDNYYTDLSGDLRNELLSGRFYARDSNDIKTIVSKLIFYEKAEFQDTNWLKKATIVINAENEPGESSFVRSDSIYFADADSITNVLMSHGFESVEILCDTLGDNADSVMQSINDGRAFITYRGIGSNGDWWRPFFLIRLSHVLQNYNKLPIMVLGTCLSYTLESAAIPSLIESYFVAGTPEEHKGIVGAFATTTGRYMAAEFRGKAVRSFYNVLFNLNIHNFGDAAERARRDLLEELHDTIDYKGYTVLGDPTMSIYTQVPENFQVNHDSSIFVFIEQNITIEVTSQGMPVESALVVLYNGKDIHTSTYTDANGNASFNIRTKYNKDIHLTVLKENFKPYSGIIKALIPQGFPYPEITNVLIISPDEEGEIEPSKTFLIYPTLKNEGNETDRNIRILATTDDTLLLALRNSFEIDSLLAGDSLLLPYPLVFSVKPEHRGGVRTLKFYVSDQWNREWIYEFDIIINTRQIPTDETGPDPFGYYAYDNEDIWLLNRPVYQWFEIDSIGTRLTRVSDADDDTMTIFLPLRINFKFYGSIYRTAGISSNGFIEFPKSTNIGNINNPIPTVGGPKRLVAGFWTDLDLSSSGDIYTYYDSLNSRFIIEYKNCALKTDTSKKVSFQIILMDQRIYQTPTGDSPILINYQRVDDASLCTVGIEDGTETRGIQYLYNESYARGAKPIQSGRSVLFTTQTPDTIPTPWFFLHDVTFSDSEYGNGNGSIEPGETLLIYLNLQNGGQAQAENVSIIISADTSVYEILEITPQTIPYVYPGELATFNIKVRVKALKHLPALSMTALVVSNQGFFTNYIYFDPYNLTNGENLPYSKLVSLIPNPFKGELYLIVKNSDASEKGKNISVSVFDIQGREIFSKKLILSTGRVKIWDGSTRQSGRARAGVYFVKISFPDNSIMTKRVLKIE